MAAGAYYGVPQGSCAVFTNPNSGVIQSAIGWNPDAPAAPAQYPIWEWNYLFPACAVPKPTHCPDAPVGTPANPYPPNPNPPEDPITGDPPQITDPPCGPPTTTPPDDGHSSSKWSVGASRGGSGSGSGAGGGFGDGPNDFMGQPLVVGLTPLATYTDSGVPIYTHDVEIDITLNENGGTSVNSLHEGTGDGTLCVHPPELQDYMLHGSGTNPHSRWPTEISTISLLLHNSGRGDASTGDITKTYLSFGCPLSTTVKPRSGVYFDFSPSTGVLNIQHTDSAGADTTVSGGVTVDGVAVGSGSGDVVGPASSTSGDIAYFDDTTGKSIANGSGVSLLDIALNSENLSGMADVDDARSNIGAYGSGDNISVGTIASASAASSSITAASTPSLDYTHALAGSDVRKRTFPVRASITAGTSIMSWAVASGDSYVFSLRCQRKRTDSGGQSAFVNYSWHVQDIGGAITITALDTQAGGGLAASVPVLTSTKGGTPLGLTIAPTAGTEVWNGFIEAEGPLNT